MSTQCYSRRLMVPFHGTIHTISVEDGEAETTDGYHWVLYVAHDDIVAHTGLSEIRYGTWNREQGASLATVRGTARSALIEAAGERLIAALERHADELPFPRIDRHECWLLDPTSLQPLVLLESRIKLDQDAVLNLADWRPAQAAFAEFVSHHGDAGKLTRAVNERIGRQQHGLWISRQSDGSGQSLDGTRFAASVFPRFMLSETWRDESVALLVKDFLLWQAPWLLQLDGYDDQVRVQLEAAAWKRPLESSRVFRLFTGLIDHEGLTTARVRARLMGSPEHGAVSAEPFSEPSPEYHPI